MDRKKKIGRLINYFSLTMSIFFRLFSMAKYKTIIVYSNPPILPWVSALASKLFGCKMIFVAYDLYPEIALRTNTLSETSMITRVMNHINRVVFRRASAVVALSSEMKNYIIQNRDIDEDHVFVIPNWYEDQCRNQTENSSNSFASVVKDRFVVGYFGNMGIAQDMDILLNAMRFYKNRQDICFLLAGHGCKREEICRAIRDENIENAYVYDFLQGQAYLDALNISHCALITLQKDLSGLCVPSKTYGYMMAGLPLMAVMEESDIVTDVRQGAGYHIADHSAQELIRVIEEMKNDPQECARRGKISRQIYLANYTPQKCLDKYIQLMKYILHEK